MLDKKVWDGRGNNPILVTDDQAVTWLVYKNVDDTGEQILARHILLCKSIEISKQGIDCMDIAAVACNKNVIIIWNQLVNGVYQLFEGDIFGSEPRQITWNSSSVINPKVTVDTNGILCLVYQKSDQYGYFNIYMQRKINDIWSEPILVSDIPGNNWCPDIVCCSDGKLAIAWDGYASGSYDIYLRFIDKDGGSHPIMKLTDDGLFNANVSLSPAPDGAVWVAWNKGTPDWGKDNEVYRNTRIVERNYLHTRRFIELRRVFPTRILPVYPPIQDYLDSKLPGMLHERPVLYSTANSPLYLGFRYNQGELSGGHRNDKRWQAIITCYDGQNWADCIELEDAYGLSTGTISIKPGYDDVVFAAACGEGGNKKTKVELETRISLYQLIGMGNEIGIEDPPMEGRIFCPPNCLSTPLRYGIKYKNENYNLYFGDLHRHTELSFCRTSVDGSLEEAYRYAKDAAQMDFVMTADHDHQEQAPDIWAQTMKHADKFNIPGYFTTFFGYEWIGGLDNRRHRNIISTVRVPVPPFDYVNGHRDIKNTWATLQKGKAITVPHHTACNMSLIWGKDPGEASDPVLEPLVEIFQSSRSSSEYPNCPTLCNAFYQTGESKGFNVEGGFVSDALKQNIRMGFIASSDHMTTHRSYACLYSKENTREALMEAMIARRAYGASDRIICEFFINSAIMGEEIKIGDNDPLEVYIKFIGTARIKEVTLLRDSSPFITWTPKSKEIEILSYINSIDAKGHYFYVRMIQEDTNMAWSSPIWID